MCLIIIGDVLDCLGIGLSIVGSLLLYHYSFPSALNELYADVYSRSAGFEKDEKYRQQYKNKKNEELSKLRRRARCGIGLICAGFIFQFFAFFLFSTVKYFLC